MKYFPIFLDLRGRHALVVGGGEPAVQKTRLLLKTPVVITVVAVRPDAELVELAAAGRIALHQRAFAEADLDGVFIAYGATGDPAQNAPIAAAAKGRGVLINVVDEPAPSDFITPAIVDRDPITVAIGSEGASPVLAREIKTHLEAYLPSGFGRVARAAADLRERVADAIQDMPARRRFWERLLKGSFRAAAISGDSQAAERAVVRELATTGTGIGQPGRVILIGCGPGAGDLITLRAQQALQRADVLVIDRLVPNEVVEHARREAKRIYVGKTPGGPSTPQDDINATLVREGLQGRVVARLKGGDAFVFGRAAEEMAAVRAAGLDVEVIPGITAAHACAARIGLPLTLRNTLRQFTILTGATADGHLDLDWSALTRDGHAFAVYMGVESAARIRSELLAAGGKPETPVVIVENGTLSSERAFATTLSDLTSCVSSQQVKAPAILFFGLDWSAAGLSRPASVKVFSTKASVTAPWSQAAVAEATHWVMG